MHPLDAHSLPKDSRKFARRMARSRAAAPAAGGQGVSGAAFAKALLVLETLRRAALYKRTNDPLSIPTELKEKMKRTVYGDMCMLVLLLAVASTAGANPLCMAGPHHEGAFVAINHRLELSGAQGGYLFMFALAFLHRVALPPLDEYSAKKSATTTPWRWSQEELRLYDPDSGSYCAVHALIGASRARGPLRQRAQPGGSFGRLRAPAGRSVAVLSASDPAHCAQAPRGRVTPALRGSGSSSA